MVVGAQFEPPLWGRLSRWHCGWAKITSFNRPQGALGLAPPPFPALRCASGRGYFQSPFRALGPNTMGTNDGLARESKQESGTPSGGLNS